MRTIEIQESTFKRLQQHARPLVDTADTVIERALDALASTVQNVPYDPTFEPPTTPTDTMWFAADDPLPDFRHTSLLAARVNGRTVKAN